MLCSRSTKTSVMKKLLPVLLILAALTADSQQHKWFVSVSSGFTIAGPRATLMSRMKRQGFDDESHFNFLGITGSTSYPRVTQYSNLMVRVGWQMDNKRGMYLLAGLQEKGEVSGFKSRGYSNIIFLGTSYGLSPVMEYAIWQVSAGYMYSGKGKAKCSIGPSVYGLRYQHTENPVRFQIIPGIAMGARLPLGKMRKSLGLEVFTDLNLAPPANMQKDAVAAGDFKPGKVNMISVSIGLGFSFRKKIKV